VLVTDAGKRNLWNSGDTIPNWVMIRELSMVSPDLEEELMKLYERLASDLAPWLRAAGKLRIILFITALVGTAVLFLFNPPCWGEP